jgi:hypothetical protein
MAEERFAENDRLAKAARDRVLKVVIGGVRRCVMKEDETPVRGNLSTVSFKHSSSSTRKLDMEIQVGDAEPDFTSPLTCNSSFESVASVDTQVTAAEFVRAKGLQDDDGDGGSSDAEGEGDFDLDDLNGALLQDLNRDIELERHIRDDLENYEEAAALSGAPDGWMPPQEPEGWMPKIPKNASVSAFEEIDNPGGWSNFSFGAKFSKSNEYKHHAMPAGAMPVPKDASGKQTCGDWTFFYQGWKVWDSLPEQIKNNLPEDVTLVSKYSRSGCRSGDMFPKTRQGSLDGEMLCKLGMSRARMIERDALFFINFSSLLSTPSSPPKDPVLLPEE